MPLWKIDVLIPGIYYFNTRRYFLAQLNLLYIARIEQKNYDDFNEDVRTFLMSDFLSRFDKSFSGVSEVLINNEFCRRVIWKVEM